MNRKAINTLAVTSATLALFLLNRPAKDIAPMPYADEAWQLDVPLTVPVPVGTYVHIGDCGFDRYSLPYTGAAGYCYIDQSPTQMVMNKATTDDELSIVVAPTKDTPLTDKPVVEVPAVSTPAPISTPAPSNEEKEKKKHCDKGGGNGSEGCDPGNNPDKGHDDE